MHAFEITVQRKSGDAWPVVVEQSTSGVFLPVRHEGLLQLDLSVLRSQTTPKDYGSVLGRAVFRDEVRDAFVQALTKSEDYLRVLLFIEADDLKTLRWERLCAPLDRVWDFLALTQRVPFCLYLPSLTDRRFPPIGRRDLRALVLVASPDELERYRLQPFDVMAAVSSVRTALGEIPCDILAKSEGAVGPPTLDALCERITAEPYTLLHVVCHGQFRRETGETVLYWDTADQRVDPVAGTRLLERLGRLQGARSLPHFAFLATCESARAEAEGALGGLAQRLVREIGMPAVVAMTETVSVTTAQALGAAFYGRLREHGEVDRALVEACAGFAERYDITVPALYSRLGGRPLFSNTRDGPLTHAEIGFALDRLETLLAVRAPVLQEIFQTQAVKLRGTLGADVTALSVDARQEREQALVEVNKLCGEALDLSFDALALGQEPPAYDGRCPFRGLYPFRQEDREFFFGREALIEHLQQKLAAYPCLPVLGPSGSGKSSVVLAGLLPALQALEPDLQMAYLTPGADPLTQLEASVASVHDGRTVLVVDQFEELFTLCTDQEARQAFLGRLLALAEQRRLVITMRADFWGECAPYHNLKDIMQARQELIAPMDVTELRRAMELQASKVGLRFEADLSHTILEDVQGEPGAMPLLQHALLELWKRRHGRWLRAEEYRAIGGVQQAMARTADDLYEQLSPGEQERVRDIFMRLTRLDDDVVPGEARRDTRRRVELRELVPAASDPTPIRALVNRLADSRLVVTSRNEAAGREEVEVAHEALIRYWPRLRGWLAEDRASLRLRDTIRQAALEWEAGSREDNLLVHRGGRLRDAEALARHPRFPLNAREQAYVDACVALRETQRAQEDAQRQRELEAARQLAAEAEARRQAEEQARQEAEQRAEEQASATRRLRRRAIGLLVVLAIAIGIGIVAYQNARTATRTLVDADFLQATEKIEQQQVDKALAYLARAVRTSSQDRLAYLARAVHTSSQDRAAADRIFSLLADRRFLLPASAPTTLPGRITATRFTPDDRWLVAVINGSTAQVFDVRSGKAVTPPLEHDGRPVQMAHISPDGKLLATACGVSNTPLEEAAIWPQRPSHPDTAVTEAPGYGRVWDITTSQPRTHRLEHEAAVLDIRFDAAGMRVATASDDQSVRVWDVSSGQLVTAPLKHEAPVTGVRFSPDGTQLAAVAKHLRIWDIASALPVGNSPDLVVVTAEYSPDGQRIAAVAWSEPASWRDSDKQQQLVLLNASTGLPGGPGSVVGPLITSFVFKRDNNDVFVSYAGKYRNKDTTGVVVETWDDAKFSRTLDELGRGPIAAVALAPYASEIFVAYFDRTVLWTSESGSVISSFTLPEPPLHIAVSASGKELIVIFGAGGDAVQLWNLETHTQYPELHSLPELPDLPAELDSPWEAGAIVDTSPDGKRVLKYDTEDALIVADKSTGVRLSDPMRAVGGYEGGGISTAKFSPNGKLIAIGEGGSFYLEKGFARIWNATTGQPLTDPLAHSLAVTFVAFSADHERLVTIGSKVGPGSPGLIQVWDVRTGRPLTDALKNGSHAVLAKLSRHDGQLTAVSTEGLAERRDVAFPLKGSLPQWLPLLAELVGGWRLNGQTGILEPLPDRWQKLASLRAEFASSRARDPYTRLGVWFLGNSQTRTVSPYSELTVTDYVARCIADGGETCLDHAEALAAGNSELLAQIRARRAQQ